LKILAILGSGGHTAQMLRLVDMLGTKFDYIYGIGEEDSLSEKKIKIIGKVFYIHAARKHGDNILVTFFKIIRLSVESLVLIAKANPNAIISAGPGIAVPISLIGKVFGKKVIFIEDWSRVYHKSSAGRIVYRFADLFFIQWPELNKVYPKGIFAGRLS